MADTAIIQANIDARKIGEALFEIAQEEIGRLPETHRRMAWALLAYRIADGTGTINDCQSPASNKKPVMASEQAIGFGRGQLPFTTKHGSKTIAEIELGYLHWLREKHEKDHVWFEKLGAYLDSERVQAESDDDQEVW